MLSWFQELDRVLRGEVGDPTALAEGRLPVSGRRLATVSILLAVIYGLCMGVFALVNRDEPEWRQTVASMIKVPALFVLTLIVTFPSLYVFNALVGSKLPPHTMARLMAAAFGVLAAVLASFGPIVAFFSFTTTSYSFMLLMNVAVFGVAGLLGLSFLFRTLSKLTAAMRAPRPEDLPPPAPGAITVPPPLRPTAEAPVRSVFTIWVIVFALVSMQMSWILRPFLGDPHGPFAWYRPRSSSFFEAVIQHLAKLFGGG